MELLLEVTVTIDEDEVDTTEKLRKKKNEVRKVIESIDPYIGIFTVENILGDNDDGR